MNPVAAQQRNSVRFLWSSKSSFLLALGRAGNGNKVQFCGVSACRYRLSVPSWFEQPCVSVCVY
eukprot:2385933-Prymnesium_polylepis.1